MKLKYLLPVVLIALASLVFLSGQITTYPGTAGPAGAAGATGSTGATGATGAAGALTLISQSVLGGTAASVVFSSIPATYSDLRVTWTARGDTAATGIGIQLRLNVDSGANYNRQNAFINNSYNSASNSFGDTSMSLGSVVASSGTANYAGSGNVSIFAYKGTTFYKNSLSFSMNINNTTLGSGQFTENAGQWLSTAAVTSVTLFPATGNFIAGSVFTLYGVS